MKKATFILIFAAGALIAGTAISIRGQSTTTSDEQSSGITTKTNQYGATTNEFGTSTNQYGTSTNLSPTSTNKLPRIYGTNTPSESSGASNAPSDVPK